jgi:3-oxoadipate enol-lactonase
MVVVAALDRNPVARFPLAGFRRKIAPGNKDEMPGDIRVHQEVAVDRSPRALPPVRTRVLDLPGRGRTVVEDAPGPPGAPTLVLLHGVALTAQLNWGGIVEPLRANYRVVMLDLRGHGNGVRTSDFRLEDCADDIAAVAAELGIERLIAVGYSMGGLVAQLLWRRHPELVSGLVLCSTARNVSGSPWERTTALTLPFLLAGAAWMPALHVLRADVVGAALLDSGITPADRQWALSQMRRTSLIDALAAVRSVAVFTSHTWIGSVDVPSAVVVTRHDRVVHAHRQHKLARALPDSTVIEIDGGHDVFLEAPARLAAAIEAACAAVCADADERAVGA